MIKYGVSGVLGKMGSRIVELASQDRDFQLTLALERMTHPGIGTKVGGCDVVSDKDKIRDVDGLIDFSSVEATLDHLDYCLKFKKPMVIGTTGFSQEEKEQIKHASGSVPIVFSPNMSIGVNLLFELAHILAASLPEEYHISMTEAHHIHKKDAPSGTAKFLSDIIKKERGSEDIPIQSVREGEIVGDHEVVFESPCDTIRISHHAKTRDIFVKGALSALKFVVKKKNGLYTMAEVLEELRSRSSLKE